MTAMLVWTVLFVAGLAALLKASSTFTKQAETVGLSYGISPFIVGVTIVAVGTSLPELISSLLGVINGAPEIVIGNVVGSNIANICLILGLVGLVGKQIRVKRELIRVDLPLLAASAVFLTVAVWGSAFTRLEGILFLAALVGYLHFTIHEKEGVGDADLEAAVEEDIADTGVGRRTYGMMAVSLVAVFVTAQIAVTSIIELAGLLGIDTGFIALTAVAVGTSLPELAVSIAAARNGVPEIAVGNILGSNIFNTFAVMGVPALLGPITIPADIRTIAIPTMVLATLLYFFMTQDKEITFWESGILLLLYLLFLVNMVGAL